MKIKIEIAEGDEEIVIRCRERDARVAELERVLGNVLRGSGEMTLYLAGTEYFVAKSDILFFESEGDKIYARTADKRYVTDYRPGYFVRISKSAIANVKAISSLRREVTGNGEISFKNCDRQAWFSRSYYKRLRDKINEVRFGK